MPEQYYYPKLVNFQPAMNWIGVRVCGWCFFSIFQCRHRHWNQPVSVTDQYKKVLQQKSAELLTLLNTSCRMLPMACNNLNVQSTNESNHKPVFSTEQMTQKWGLKFAKAESLWSDMTSLGVSCASRKRKQKNCPGVFEDMKILSWSQIWFYN